MIRLRRVWFFLVSQKKTKCGSRISITGELQHQFSGVWSKEWVGKASEVYPWWQVCISGASVVFGVETLHSEHWVRSQKTMSWCSTWATLCSYNTSMTKGLLLEIEMDLVSWILVKQSPPCKMAAMGRHDWIWVSWEHSPLGNWVGVFTVESQAVGYGYWCDHLWHTLRTIMFDVKSTVNL